MNEEIESGMEPEEEVTYTNKGNKKLIILIIVLLIIGIIVYFLLNRKESINVNIDKKGESTISVLPLTDESGITSMTYFDFTFTGTVDKKNLYYEILISPKSTNTLNTSSLKTYLTDQSNNPIFGVTLYNELANSETANGKIIYRNVIKVNSDGSAKQEYKDFRLRMWNDSSNQTTGNFDFDISVNAYYVESDFVIRASAPLLLDSYNGIVAPGESMTVKIITDSDGVINCTSSNVLKATCEITRKMLKVNGVEYGDATITVSQEAGSLYTLPNSVSYYVSIPDTRVDSKMSLEKTSGSVYVGKSISEAITTTGDGVITCRSSNDKVATCEIKDNTLKIKGLTAGDSVITISQTQGEKTHAPKDITYEVKVSLEPTPKPTPTPTPQSTPAATTISSASGVETAPFGKVYVGKNPSNYVVFNNESWRIIGVYGDNLKIVRSKPTTSKQVFNKKDSDGNKWDGSAVQSYLYNSYNSIIKDESSRKMILEDATWYIAKSIPQNNASAAYNDSKKTEWKGKIGLITTYEYLYAAPKSCWKTNGVEYKSTCGKNDWLYITLTSDGGNGSWTLTPDKAANRILRVHPDRFVDDNPVSSIVSVSPVVYLKKSVSIASGKGTESNPYKLK